MAFEDIEPGLELTSPERTVSAEEIVAFAKDWDPQAFHLSEAGGRDSIFGGLVGCAAHVFALQSRLSLDLPREVELLAGLGNEGFALPNPLRPGDRVRVVRRYLEKRRSRSKPDRGVVKIEQNLLNHRDDVIFSAIGNLLVRCRS